MQGIENVRPPFLHRGFKRMAVQDGAAMERWRLRIVGHSSISQTIVDVGYPGVID